MEYRERVEVLNRGDRSVISNYKYKIKKAVLRFYYDPTAGKLVTPVITYFLAIIVRNPVTIILYTTPSSLICLTSFFLRIPYTYTVRPLLSALVGRTKFWSQKPRIIEVQIIEAYLYFI